MARVREEGDDNSIGVHGHAQGTQMPPPRDELLPGEPAAMRVLGQGDSRRKDEDKEGSAKGARSDGG